MTSVVGAWQGEAERAVVLAGGKKLFLDCPLVMGVVNVTPDSFSDGGRYETVAMAVSHALEMVEQGADIIDIGGESSRPGAAPVPADEERRRVMPVIEELRRRTDIPISIDTYKSSTARAALEVGADIVNDISALRFDEQMAGLIAAERVPVVLMHMRGSPRNMQDDPRYRDCVEEIAGFLAQRIEFCTRSGISRSQIIVDPGIGFGKRLSDNLEILSRLGRFKQLSQPLLVGASRKSFIGQVHPTGAPAERRLGGSIAAAVTAVINGADIVRVHDVAETVEAVRVVQAIRKTA